MEKEVKVRHGVGYIRVSTDAQVEKYGAAAQRTHILNYAKEHNIVIDEWKYDEGKSGAKEDRPALDEIIFGQTITNPPIDCCVVAKSDRIARDVMIYYYYRHELLRKSIDLISATEDFGEFGYMAPICEAMTLAWAQKEREDITKRTMSGRKEKSMTGGYCGGRVPYGYRVVNHELEIDPHEKKVVRIVFELMDKGCSTYRIAQTLMDAGYRSRNGGMFSNAHIKGIEHNRKLYEGYYRYSNGEYTKGKQMPIIFENEFPNAKCKDYGY